MIRILHYLFQISLYLINNFYFISRVAHVDTRNIVVIEWRIDNFQGKIE